MDTTQHNPNIYIPNKESVTEVLLPQLGNNKEFYSDYVNREIWHMINGIMQHHNVGEILLNETELSFTYDQSSFNPELLKHIPNFKTRSIWSNKTLTLKEFDPFCFATVKQEPETRVFPVFHIRFNTKYEKVYKLSQMLLTAPNTPIIIRDPQGNSLNLTLTHQFPLFWFEKFIIGI